jgi:hypothetical protein
VTLTVPVGIEGEIADLDRMDPRFPYCTIDSSRVVSGHILGARDRYQKAIRRIALR